MYIDALKDIIRDLVNISGEENDPRKVEIELDRANTKIERLENLPTLSSYDKMDLDVAKTRKEYLERSASIIGKKILEGFENGEDKEKITSLFNILFERATKSFNEINSLIVENDTNNIWDLINKKNIELIKLRAKPTKKDKENNYSNVAKHYENKKQLIENTISALTEKKILVNESIDFYNEIIENIKEEIRRNNDVLLSYNEIRYSMAYILCEESDYVLLNEEIEKLRQIKTFNEEQLKEFQVELEKCLKEKEQIEKETTYKNEELAKTIEMLEEFKEKTTEGEYISKENIVERNFETKQREKEIERLELAKNLMYINLDRIKETALGIILKYDGINDPMVDLVGEFTKEEINEIKDIMKEFDISKEDAIKTFEVKRNKQLEEQKLTEYMNEFDFSIEEAKEALKNEKSEKRFWDPENL